MSQLESIEWTQYWSEDTRRDKKRVLLIGDSISVGYRSEVHKRLGGDAYVTAISTSKGIDNPNLIREIDLYAHAENFEYGAIHFNNGLHGFHLDDNGYRAGYEQVILYFKEHYAGVRLILALSTPVTVNKHPETFSEMNDIVLRRNRIVCELAKKYGLEVNDLYACVADRAELSAGDGYHYKNEGYECLAEQIASVLLEEAKK
ncbi:MAG: SGNH/GDSL hydrolase family protein [Clostridia bacterium]|nr:SGNH/GDSL hydrolase family protein [Clostridia bacterium]